MICVQLYKHKPIFKLCNYDNNRKEKLKIKQLLKVITDNQIIAEQKNCKAILKKIFTFTLKYWNIGC